MAETKHTKSFYTIDIPSDWDVKKLGKLGNIVSGLTYSPEDVCEETGVLVLRSSNVQGGRITFDDNVYVKVEEGEYNPVKKGDILICVRNGSKGLIGKCALIPDKASGMAFGAFMTIFRGPHNAYLIHVFNTDIYNREIHKNLGATINSINGSDLKQFKIPLPPLPEQKAIARVLSTWDEAIRLTQELIAQKEQQKKWLMQVLLTGKKRLKGFKGEWKKYPYNKILKIVKRPVTWNDSELYNLISVRRRSGGIFFREALLGYQIKVKDLRTARQGDFLFSKMQIVHGASALVTDKFDGAKISGSYIATVAQDPNLLNMEFFGWYSRLPYFYHQSLISSYGVHIEKMTFDFDSFLQLEVKLPSLEEQTSIVKVLQAADNEIGLLKAKAEDLQQQKKGLMQQLLTGKKRLFTNLKFN